MRSTAGVRWAEVDGQLVPSLDDHASPVGWTPLPGAQTIFAECPVFEALLEGPRGGGKSDSVLMDYCADVGRGFGADWRGVIFRQTYPQLADMVAKSNKWIRSIYPEAKFNQSDYSWRWPDGEVLMFRHMANPRDYWHHHGQQYGFVGFDELTNYASPECYLRVMSCVRSANPDVSKRVRMRSATNPGGVGHIWVKDRFGLPVLPGNAVGRLIKNPNEPARIAINCPRDQNTVLETADPNYVDRIAASASTEAQKRAWLYGDWNIVAGGLLDHCWSDYNVVTPFEIPESWRIDRGFDWGSSAPFSVIWFAESDGTSYTDRDGQEVPTVPGDIFAIHQWYGTNGQPNQGLKMLARDIAVGIKDRESRMPWGKRVVPGPADSAIYKVENGNCIATDMERKGVSWTRADKSPGSRVTGWETVQRYLADADPDENGQREEPGLFIFSHCTDILRTVPVLPRSEKNPDDADTDAEDHDADTLRYKVRSVSKRGRTGKRIGGRW